MMLTDVCEVMVNCLPRHACSLSIEHNCHRDGYMSVREYLELVDADADEIAECVAADTVWSVHWYPDTPVGSYMVHASTLEGALRKAMQVKA